MRRSVLGLSLVACGLALAPVPSPPAAAGCAARELSVAGDLGSRQSPVVLVRGEEVTVDGHRFIDGCDDTGGGDAFGCSTEEPEPEIPVEDARLELLESPASEHGLVLGEADADDGGRVSWTVTIPADAPLGRGVLVAAFSEGLHVVVRTLVGRVVRSVRAMIRPLARPLLALATAFGLLLVAPAPATAVTHSGPNWSWDGPADWTAAYGTYGITVLGDQGATLDLGFSSTLCASGATWEKSVKKWFRGVRKQLRQSGWDLKAGKIKKPQGFSSTYRRQVLKGTNDAQGTKRGEITVDYDFTTTVDGVSYCYSRNLAKYANAKAWAGQKKTLKHVQNSLAYFGPGAPEGEDPDEF